VSFFPSMFTAPGLVMSWTTLSWLHISLRAASILASIVRNVCAASMLMSGLRPEHSSESADGSWTREPRKLAASAHTNASSVVGGSDAFFPRRRLHTSRTILSTDAWCLRSTR